MRVSKHPYRDSRTSQKNCAGFGDVYPFGQDIHIDQNLKLAIPIGLLFLLVILPADRHTGSCVPNGGNHIVQGDSDLPELNIQCNRMVDIYRKDNGLAIFAWPFL